MSDDVQRRVIIACGGTGGHLFPGIAVAEALRRKGHAVLLLISEKEIDALAAKGHGDLEFRRLPAVGMGRLLSLKTLKFLMTSWSGYRQCRSIVREFRANAVLGMGGFTSTPPIVAGRRLGCRTFIHESNAIPGKANRLTARFCDVVLLGVEDCAAHFPARETRIVGTPVRTTLREPVDRAAALREFGLAAGRRTLLIMGGSQGARNVNRLVGEALRDLDAELFQVIHITGPADHAEVTAAYRDNGVALTAAIVPFLHAMHHAYALADLAISRSGASSLAELAFFGVPSIVIPYPFAAEDHQRRNAEGFSRRGAAVLLDEKGLTGAALGKTVRDLFSERGRLETMSANASRLAVKDAAEKICEVIEEVHACVK